MSGILDNKDVKIDIVYTKLGRYYKSINSPLAEITKYSLGDDGIDYNLYDETMPKEDAIKKMMEIPLINTSTYNRGIKYKLVTLPFDTEIIPTFEISQEEVIFNVTGQTGERKVQTLNLNTNFNSKNGFRIFFEERSEFLDILLPDRFMIDDSIAKTSSEKRQVSDDKNQLISRSRDGDITEKTKGKEPIRTIRDDKMIETKLLTGSSSSPATLSFDIVYDSKRRRFVSDKELTTQLIIESNDLGIRKSIDVSINKKNMVGR